MSFDKLQTFADRLLIVNWSKKSIPILLIFSSAFAVFLFGVNIKAQWWVIDDHEIVYFLGSDNLLGGSEIPEKLFQDTEIGHYLQLPRFRPIYYALRLLECWAWGDNPSLWYAFRVCVFVVFIGIFWYLISRKVGWVIGGFLSLYVAIQLYWPDIISRLGPSEAYAVLGLALFGWGVYGIYKSDNVTGWWYLFGGMVLCSGAKENFLFLIVPLLYIVWDFYKRKKLSLSKAVLSLGAFIWMMWIGLTVVLSTFSSGRDVYENPVGIRDRLLILIGMFQRMDVIILLSVCLLLLLSRRVFLVGNSPLLLEHYHRHVAAAWILLLVYFSQIFIYGIEWPVGTRYDFPGTLVIPLMLVILFSFFERLTAIKGKQYRVGLIMFSVFVTFILAFSQLDNVSTILNTNKMNVERTANFSMKMKQLAEYGIQNPEYVFIIQTDNPSWDYESVFSYFRFLRFYDVQNQISFLWAGRKPDTYSNAFRISLASDLQDLSFYGELPLMVAGSEKDFTPFSEVDGSETKCILVLLSGSPQKNCQIMVEGNWR